MAAAGNAKENRELVADKFTPAIGEDGRTAHSARALPLAFAGGKPSDTAACQSVGTDSFDVTSVGIAEGAAEPKKTIPISS